MIKYYVEALVILVAVAVLVFLFSSAIQGVQINLNGQLASNNWLTEANWESFNLANTFVNNIWLFFVVFVVFGVLYYGYVTAQKQGAGI